MPNKRILICLTHYSDNGCEYLISMKISIRNSHDDFTHFRRASSVGLANYCRGCVRNCLWMNAQGQHYSRIKRAIIRRNFSESERTRFYDERSNELGILRRWCGRHGFQSCTIKLPPVRYKFHEMQRVYP